MGWRAERQWGDGGFLARGESPRTVNTGEAVNTVGFLFDPEDKVVVVCRRFVANDYPPTTARTFDKPLLSFEFTAIIPIVKAGLIDRWRFRDVQPLLPTS